VKRGTRGGGFFKAGARRRILGEEYPDTRSAAKDLARRINRGSQKRCHKWMPKGGEWAEVDA
jgi:hypothetical protein